MNKFISILYIVCALVASAQCKSYGYGYGYDNDYGYGYGSNVQSYALGSGGYAAPAYQSYYYSAQPKYSVQALSSQELYPGRNSYRSYNYAPSYSQVALPVVASAPLAKLYNYGGAY